MTERLSYFWDCLPVGRENAVTYQTLCSMWGCNERKVRSILHDLSYNDNGDNYILIRSSHGKGFYKTNDVQEIERYKREVTNRARHTFKSLHKVRRVLRDLEGSNVS